MNTLIRILLVEDNLGDARLVEIALRRSGRHGFTVETVPQLEAALSRLSAESFDVVLLDLSLPDSSGTESVRKLREAAPHVAVVVISGTDEEEAARQALERGAQDYLVKGRFDFPLLERTVRYALLRQRFGESEEKFRRMIEASPDPISLNDLETGAYVEVNDAWCRFTGAERDEVIGRRVGDLGFWADEHELRDFVGRLGKKGPVHDFTAQFRVRSGLRFGSISATVLALKGKRSVLSWTRDVTEQHRTEQLRGDLARMLSHDLKNPLGVILLAVEELRAKLRGRDDVEMDLDAIEANARQAAALAINLLDAEAIESQSLRIQRRPTSLNDVVEHVLQHHASRARRRQVDLRVDLDGSLPKMELDEAMIERAVANLVGNAVKFSPDGGAVTIVTRADTDHVVLQVHDRGPGISEDDRPHLFQRYGRGTQQRVDSTGLGLFIVRAVVEAHGGTVRARTPTDGAGSVFEVVLPKAFPTG